VTNLLKSGFVYSLSILAGSVHSPTDATEFNTDIIAQPPRNAARGVVVANDGSKLRHVVSWLDRRNPGCRIVEGA